MDWINVREGLLNALLATSRKEVLNHMICSGLEKTSIPEAMARCILDIKNNAVLTDSGVRYVDLQGMDSFNDYCMASAPCLRKFDPNTLQSREEKLAFWINLYNLMVLDAVIRFAVTESVAEGWLGVLRFFRRAAYTVNGLRFSLEDIEHGILRGNRGFPFFPGAQFSENDERMQYVLYPFDPRIHFALNCASRSCPPIAFYSAENLDQQLNLATANFIDSETSLGKHQQVIQISRIFKWYESDFSNKEGCLDFIQKYLPDEDQRKKWIINSGAHPPVQYLSYDWSLNKAA